MLKISVYLICFFITMIAMTGVDFTKIMRKHSERKMILLSILLAMGIAYAVAEFILSLTIL